MGLIIKDKIPMFMRGYPTVSDKYNVSGGILSGDAPAKFGDLVKTSNTAGYFLPAAGAANVDVICGFILATNVKLAEDWPGKTVQVNPGEAFNLMVNGFMAIELATNATLACITPNAKVCVTLTTGICTTADKYVANTIPYLPNVVFTGMYEKTADNKILAEIYIK